MSAAEVAAEPAAAPAAAKPPAGAAPAQPAPQLPLGGASSPALPVRLLEGSSLGTSGGAVLLEGLCAEATVRTDASGGAVVGLACGCKPASFLEVAVGQVGGWAASRKSCRCGQRPQRQGCPLSFP